MRTSNSKSTKTPIINTFFTECGFEKNPEKIDPRFTTAYHLKVWECGHVWLRLMGRGSTPGKEHTGTLKSEYQLVREVHVVEWEEEPGLVPLELVPDIISNELKISVSSVEEDDTNHDWGLL